MAFSQQTGHVEISLINPDGRAVSDGLVELLPLDRSGIARVPEVALQCNGSGRCTGDVVAGTYRVVVHTLAGTASLEKFFTVVPGRSNRIALQVSNGSATLVASLGTIHVSPTDTLTTGSAPSSDVDARQPAERGERNFSALLEQQAGVTLNRPNGGSTLLPVSIVLRGSDPKETIVQIDGNPLNNGNTGDADISLLDPSAFSDVQVVYGLAPASQVGANTEGGTINFHTLDPTASPHGLLRYGAGSFSSNGYTFASTGTHNDVGYAVEWHGFNEAGSVNAFPALDVQSGNRVVLGSANTSSNALAKVAYALPRSGLIQFAALTLSAHQDLSAALSTPADPNSATPDSPFTSYAGSNRNLTTSLYDGSVRLALGRALPGESPVAFLTARFMSTSNRQEVSGPADGLSEYLSDTSDVLRNASLDYERPLPNAVFSLEARMQSEDLTSPDAFGAGTPTQSQSNHTFVARYVWNGGSRLEYTAVGYLSSFSTFGKSFDPRAAVVWRPSGQTVMRASLGTGLQAPLLSERIVPSPLPPPTVDGLIMIGNPNLKADRTLEYELDVEHAFGSAGSALTSELDLYRVNQRDDDIQFIPEGASPQHPKESFPINIADSIWQGLVLRLRAPLHGSVTLAASYNINQAYPLGLPPSLAASAGNIVPYQQFQSVPLHRATFSLQQEAQRFGSRIECAYEGSNNDLNQPAFATINADVRYSFGHTSLVLAGSNLTRAYPGKFTLAGAGVPYAGVSGPIATDAYQLGPPIFALTVTQRW